VKTKKTKQFAPGIGGWQALARLWLARSLTPKAFKAFGGKPHPFPIRESSDRTKLKAWCRKQPDGGRRYFEKRGVYWGYRMGYLGLFLEGRVAEPGFIEDEFPSVDVFPSASRPEPPQPRNFEELFASWFNPPSNTSERCRRPRTNAERSLLMKLWFEEIAEETCHYPHQGRVWFFRRFADALAGTKVDSKGELVTDAAVICAVLSKHSKEVGEMLQRRDPVKEIAFFLCKKLPTRYARRLGDKLQVMTHLRKILQRLGIRGKRGRPRKLRQQGCS
jgi:hypothetical protein